MKDPNETRQERKERAANGSRTQKMMSFRLDTDLIAWLASQPNKGRLINELLRAERDRQNA